MSETWKQWEGRIVNGEFPLSRYLGGSRHSAVFVTGRKSGAPEKAVIKLIRADATGADAQLKRWQQAAELNHPNLVYVFESGRCEVDGTPLLYLVMEAAEEDLSQILPERSLSPDEVRQLLPPVLEALAHLHGRGMVHGRIRPSNILASGDQVKVSSDTLRASGERVPSPDGWGGYDAPESSSERLTPAADVWSLAVTLVQTLTKQRPLWHPAKPEAPSLPENTPEPFREIARRCLLVDPQQRWTVADIQTALRPKSSKAIAGPPPKPPVPASSNIKKKPVAWGWALVLIAIAAVALILFVGRKRGNSSTPSQLVEAQPQVAGPANDALPESSSTAPKPSAAPTSRKASARASIAKTPSAAGANGTVLQQVMPQVAPSARHTIEGKIKVGVRVEVDPSGNVTAAKLFSPGPSKYFARVAVDAARQWKFNPPQIQGQAVASQWDLRFGFRRSGTEVSSAQVTR
jgi:TonB family protein